MKSVIMAFALIAIVLMCINVLIESEQRLETKSNKQPVEYFGKERERVLRHLVELSEYFPEHREMIINAKVIIEDKDTYNAYTRILSFPEPDGFYKERLVISISSKLASLLETSDQYLGLLAHELSHVFKITPKSRCAEPISELYAECESRIDLIAGQMLKEKYPGVPCALRELLARLPGHESIVSRITQLDACFSCRNTDTDAICAFEHSKDGTWRVLLPRKHGNLVERHIQKMFDRRYALEISPDDLGHGHMMLAPDTPFVTDIDSLFLNLKGVVYHTDERSIRLKKEAEFLAPSERTPRSLVGWQDGSIVDARQYVTPESSRNLDNYLVSGTVSQADIAKFFGLMDDDAYSSGENKRHPSVKIMGRNCEVQLVLYMEPAMSGKYKVGESRYNIWFSCIEK